MVQSLYYEIGEVSEVENFKGRRYNPDEHCVQREAYDSLYSGRYDLSTLGFQPLPEFIPKQDTWGELLYLGLQIPNENLEDFIKWERTLISVV